VLCFVAMACCRAVVSPSLLLNNVCHSSSSNGCPSLLILVVVCDGKGEVAPTKGAEGGNQLTFKGFKVFEKQG
jgi:hypothetical protein